MPGPGIVPNVGPDGYVIGDLTQTECLVLLMAFIVFSVAFAVIKNLFSRMWGKIPEKNNWK